MTIDVLKTLTAKESKRSSMVSNSRFSTRSSVCRSLFGEVDHDESMDFLQKELDAITQKEIQRWNFDFVNERPLNDDSAVYEWTPVRDEEAVPKAYALSRLPYLSKNSEINCKIFTTTTTTTTATTTTTTTSTNNNNHNNNNNNNNDDNKSNSFYSPQKPVCRNDGQDVDSRLQDEVTVPKIKLTQTSIEDFMKTKKRLSCCAFSTAGKISTNMEESKKCNQCCYQESSKKLRLSPRGKSDTSNNI